MKPATPTSTNSRAVDAAKACMGTRGSAAVAGRSAEAGRRLDRPDSASVRAHVLPWNSYDIARLLGDGRVRLPSPAGPLTAGSLAPDARGRRGARRVRRPAAQPGPLGGRHG